jgi:hypothetical protein
MKKNAMDGENIMQGKYRKQYAVLLESSKVSYLP